MQFHCAERAHCVRCSAPMSLKGTIGWLPAAFAVEVVLWEASSRLGLAFVDPTWEEFGRLVHIELFTWIVGAVVALLLAAFGLATTYRSTAQISLVQIGGVLGLSAYWVGASLVSAGAVVAIATLATWVLVRRPERGARRGPLE